MRHQVKSGRVSRFLESIFWALSSLKFAVLVILSLAIALAAATIVESLYDTPSAQYWVYQSGWFHTLLALLGVNILFVAISRYPWKKKHIPFLMAHVGILILLVGSWMTDQFGIDGNLRISEGESRNTVELGNNFLVIRDSKSVYSVPVPWRPPGVKFRPISTGASGASANIPYDLRIDDFMSHADPLVSFEKANEPSSEKHAALQFKIAGGPMGISQEIWLWQGSPDWKSIQAGPAHFSLGQVETSGHGRPSISFQVGKGGELSYVATSSDGKKVKGKFPRNKIQGQVIRPGWKGDVTLTLQQWIPDAMAVTHYKPARVQYGNLAPSSAIHVVAGNSAGVWLGLGDRAVLHVADREVEIGYFSRRIVLPFSIRLERFTIEHDQGTLSPAAYSSRVTVLDEKGQKDVIIGMNEPLEYGGYTVYQASYEEGDPRPVTSIFSVNQDPGRVWKYFGSLLIVLGSVLLFAAKYRLAQGAKKVQTRGKSTQVEAIVS